MSSELFTNTDNTFLQVLQEILHLSAREGKNGKKKTEKTEKQRNKETRKQGNKETEKQRDEEGKEGEKGK